FAWPELCGRPYFPSPPEPPPRWITARLTSAVARFCALIKLRQTSRSSAPVQLLAFARKTSSVCADGSASIRSAKSACKFTLSIETNGDVSCFFVCLIFHVLPQYVF